MKLLVSLILIIICISSYAQESINKRIIDSNEISQSGASNLAELLDKISTLEVINIPFISSGVGINGISPTLDNSSVSILLDGRPIQVFNISNIALLSIDKIEIIKGSVGAMYGLNALGGAINIITKKGKETSTSLGLGYGSFNKYLFQVYKGVRLEKNLYYHVSYQNERQKKDYKIGKNNIFSPNADQKAILDPASYGARMLNSNYNKTFISAGMGYMINDNWDIYFDANGYKHKNTGISGSFYQVPENSNIKNYDQGTSNFSLTANGKINKHNISITAQYINFTDEIKLNNSENNLEEDTKHLFASIKDKYESKNFNIIAALEYRHNKYDDFYHTYPFENIILKTPSFKDEVLSASLGTHIALCNNKFNIDATIRYERIKYTMDKDEVNMLDIIHPKHSTNSNLIYYHLGLSHKLSENSYIFLNSGTSYSQPLSLYKTGGYNAYSTESVEEINKGEGLMPVIRNYMYMGNSNYKEEKTTSLNIGYSHKSKNLNFSINCFYIENKNYFGWTQVSYGFPGMGYDTPYKEKIIDGQKHYIRDQISKTFTSSVKQKQKGLNLNFSYNLEHSVLNNSIITPYFKGTFLFNNDLYNYNGLGNNQNISHFGVKLNNKDKLSCNINMKIVSSRKVRNNFVGITNVDFDMEEPESPDNMRLLPIKDINDNPIRPEIMHLNMIKLPAYGLLNFSTTYNVTHNMSLAFHANNILNENYMDIDAYHMPGRNFLVKLVFNFDSIL